MTTRRAMTSGTAAGPPHAGQQFDTWLLVTVLGLMTAGLLMVYSSSAGIAIEKVGHPYFFLFKQAIWTLLGIGVIFTLQRVDYHILQSPAIVYGLFLAIVALLVAVLLGPAINDVNRWFRFGQSDACRPGRR